MITENVDILKIHQLSRKQYERELAAGNIDNKAIYLIKNNGVDHSNILVSATVTTE